MIKVKIKEKIYDNKTKVFEDVSFEIPDSEFLTILGPSGCGKSTLLRCIGGFESFKGEVFLDNQKVSHPNSDQVMVFQDFHQLFPWFTVLENVTFALKAVGQKEGDIKQKARMFIDKVGLGKYEEFYPFQLSGGMKQRAAIARSLSLNPKVLLMDEPFGALDAQTRTVLQRELLKLWNQFNTTIIFVTHNIQESIILGDRVLVMSSNPGGIKSLYSNELDRPRRPDKKGFSEFWHVLYEDLNQSKED